MIKLEETKEKYSTDPVALKQFDDIFGNKNIESYIKEFDPFWDEMLPQAIAAHSKYGMGEWAGSGCVDYNEAKVLYIFTRIFRPKIVVELGYAGGISTSFIARGLELNGAGQVHTVDLSPEYWDVCPMFQGYRSQEIVVQYHTTDAVDFLTETKIVPILTFSDATHEELSTKKIATLLKKRWPHAIHLYHEWGMSTRSGELEKSYVSMQHLINTQFERNAFEDVFGKDARHGGFYGSCGLGICCPL